MNSTPSGPSTGRLVAIVVGVIFAIGFLTIGGLVLAGYIFVSKVNVSTVRDGNGREKTVNVETPLGRLRLDTDERVDPKLLNIPLYPGAVVVHERAGARVDLDLNFADKSWRVMAVEMESDDPPDKVIDFYRDTATDFLFSQKANGKVEFRCERRGLQKIVGIVEKSGKTRISLANIGEPEAN